MCRKAKNRGTIPAILPIPQSDPFRIFEFCNFVIFKHLGSRRKQKRKPKNLFEKFGIYYSHLPKKRRRILSYEIEIFSVFGIIFLAFSSILLFGYFETLNGIVAGDATDSVTVNVSVVSSISIDNPADVALAPNIEETGTANGSVTWNVKTNHLAGWILDVEASTTPAMKSGGNTFLDYTETVPGTPEAWSVNVADSEFGFNASGIYAEAGFGGSKYLGFDGLNQIQVAHRNAPSEGAGDDTTVGFRAEAGALHNQPLGTYSATITATASTI
jgi:hypothetical protein